MLWFLVAYLLSSRYCVGKELLYKWEIFVVCIHSFGWERFQG